MISHEDVIHRIAGSYLGKRVHLKFTTDKANLLEDEELMWQTSPWNIMFRLTQRKLKKITGTTPGNPGMDWRMMLDLFYLHSDFNTYPRAESELEIVDKLEEIVDRKYVGETWFAITYGRWTNPQEYYFKPFLKEAINLLQLIYWMEIVCLLKMYKDEATNARKDFEGYKKKTKNFKKFERSARHVIRGDESRKKKRVYTGESPLDFELIERLVEINRTRT